MSSSSMKHKEYKSILRDLQIQLVKLQNHIINNNLRLLVIFEGRDSAGKDGIIKRITEHLSPRDTRVVALGKPSDREVNSWYFQRYVSHLPCAQEMVLMNRSWYNRAGVERVMGFCSEAEYQHFMQTVIQFERMLIESGIHIVKYYLDISKQEQIARLDDRHTNPLKQWKISPIDEVAVAKWDEYSEARNEMLNRSHSDTTPWYVVSADDKKQARINVIRHLLSIIDYKNNLNENSKVDGNVVFQFEPQNLHNGKISS
ncbi:polyphosphate kinase 2 [Aliiglaciecola sp. 2_MG-2023]|uniref:polyphosphate kinase 2 n=1 Tax=Alteromonadaceae TaxID=72275 RepID=UPI0026E4389E|nr:MULTISPECIES: polyphosphate kinase 2 [unclassified Aliiglaciecola]MDO6713101.1 polyphosphate kinase 2 [Aliiglaciecola sp. 2_MG-2023]MDO6754133.1 polyphosphate kinase 2 [Aliiglaciecola sp. 1_MG-2023]